MDNVKVDLPALSEDEQFEALANAIFEKHKDGIVKEIVSKLKNAGGQRDTSITWSKSF